MCFVISTRSPLRCQKGKKKQAIDSERMLARAPNKCVVVMCSQLAEWMLPEGAHSRDIDWTLFFLSARVCISTRTHAIRCIRCLRWSALLLLTGSIGLRGGYYRMWSKRKNVLPPQRLPNSFAKRAKRLRLRTRKMKCTNRCTPLLLCSVINCRMTDLCSVYVQAWQ